MMVAAITRPGDFGSTMITNETVSPGATVFVGVARRTVKSLVIVVVVDVAGASVVSGNTTAVGAVAGGAVATVVVGTGRVVVVVTAGRVDVGVAVGFRTAAFRFVVVVVCFFVVEGAVAAVTGVTPTAQTNTTATAMRWTTLAFTT
jgi:hypothetical protein